MNLLEVQGRDCGCSKAPPLGQGAGDSLCGTGSILGRGVNYLRIYSPEQNLSLLSLYFFFISFFFFVSFCFQNSKYIGGGSEEIRVKKGRP